MPHPGHELLLVVHQIPVRFAAGERMTHVACTQRLLVFLRTAFEVVGADRGIARHLDLGTERHEVGAIHL